MKWLTELRLEVTRAPGYFTTVLYNDVVVEKGVTSGRPVWEIAPQSIIVAPAAGDRIPLRHCQVWGWAWSAVPVESVEISVDGGQTWSKTELQPRDGFSWQRFAWDWMPSAKGAHQLICRATDARADVQPDRDARNAVLRLEIFVT